MQSAKHKSTPANDPWSFVHPLTSEDAAAMTALRSAVAGMKGKLEGITARAPFNGIIERIEAPEGVTFEEDTVGGISGWWVKPAQTREAWAVPQLNHPPCRRRISEKTVGGGASGASESGQLMESKRNPLKTEKCRRASSIKQESLATIYSLALQSQPPFLFKGAYAAPISNPLQPRRVA